MNRSRSSTRPEAAAPLARDPASVAPASDPQPSTLNSQPPHIPDHELLRPIGGGSYGEVWLARNALGAYRAVKVVRRATFDHERPFEREFNGIQKFEPISRQHEGLVDLLQVGRNEAEGWFYYVMELADDANSLVAADVRRLTSPGARVSPPAATPDGGTASKDSERLLVGDRAAAGDSRGPKSEPPHVGCYEPRTLRSEIQRRRLPLDDCIALGLALTRALGYLHGQGLVHRDIKPSNIIFVGGAPKLADVGLVADVGEARSYVGTEGFIPPEGPGSPQADLYGLGIVLYVMSTGQRHEDFPAPLPDLAAQPDHARWLEFNAVIHKACAAEVRERYQSAEEMLAELELLQRGQSVRRVHGHQRLWSQVKKAALGLTLIALLVAGVARMARQTQRNEAAGDGPPSTNDLANALCSKGLLVLRGDNHAAYAETYTNLHHAIELDPNFARPYVGLLELLLLEYVPGLKTGRTNEMWTVAKRLNELAPDMAAASCARSIINYYDWNYPKAKDYVLQAIRADPNYALGHSWYGFILTQWGSPIEGRSELEISRKLLPSKVTIYRFLAHTYYVQRDYTNAIAMYREAIGWESHQAPAYFFSARAYQAMGDYSNAIHYFELRDGFDLTDNTETKTRYAALRQALAEGGARGYWQEQWNRTQKNPRENLYGQAAIQMAMGNTNAAMTLLNESYAVSETEGASVSYPLSYLLFDEYWDPLHDDLRFNEWLDKIGFTKTMRPTTK